MPYFKQYSLGCAHHPVEIDVLLRVTWIAYGP